MNSEELLFLQISWPNRKFNRNDSEYEMFKEYFRSFNAENRNAALQYMKDSTEDTFKSTNLAKKFRSEGNKSYNDKKFKDALERYNKSIAVAPRDSKEYGLALANRSAVFFDMKYFQECLLDINRLLKSEYPEDLKYKIFLRQAKCFLELSDSKQAKISLEKAVKIFENTKKKIGRIQIADINEKINEIKNQLHQNKITNCNIVLTHDIEIIKNPKYLNASIHVEIRQNKQKGRHVIAVNDIKRGDILFVEKPYAFAQLSQDENNLCAYCLHESKARIPCTTCIEYLYCSDNCRIASWSQNHKWLCTGLRKEIINQRMLLSMKILFTASRTGFKEEVKNDLVYGDEEDNHPFLFKLMTHKNDVKDHVLVHAVKNACWMVLYLRHFTDYFNWLYDQENRPEGSREQLYDIIGGYILKYLLQIYCNSELIYHGYFDQRHEAVVYIATARAIYVSAALINHSCIPNAIKIYNNSTQIIKAVADIKKGSEITVSYILEEKDLINTTVEERKQLLASYVFTCTCQMCSNPKYKLSAFSWLCPKCKGRAVTIPNTERAKCFDCSNNFNLSQYKMADFNIKIFFTTFLSDVFCEINILNDIFDAMKKIYHKHNQKFNEYYILCIKYYKERNDYKKCVECSQKVVDTAKLVYGEASRTYWNIRIKHFVLMSKYYKYLKQKRGITHEKILKETEDIIIDTIELVKYFLSEKNAREVKQEMLHYLHFNKTELEYDNECLIEEL